MELMDIERLAENYALATYLTEWDELSYDEVIAALYEPQQGDYLESITIWHPFEDFSYSDLADLIECSRNDFLQMGIKAKK
jgi:DNA-directed RNA polymerase specialized sigma24 family protein